MTSSGTALNILRPISFPVPTTIIIAQHRTSSSSSLLFALDLLRKVELRSCAEASRYHFPSFFPDASSPSPYLPSFYWYAKRNVPFLSPLCIEALRRTRVSAYEADMSWHAIGPSSEQRCRATRWPVCVFIYSRNWACRKPKTVDFCGETNEAGTAKYQIMSTFYASIFLRKIHSSWYLFAR